MDDAKRGLCFASISEPSLSMGTQADDVTVGSKLVVEGQLRYDTKGEFQSVAENDPYHVKLMAQSEKVSLHVAALDGLDLDVGNSKAKQLTEPDGVKRADEQFLQWSPREPRRSITTVCGF